jgi:hypothetical protein
MVRYRELYFRTLLSNTSFFTNRRLRTVGTGSDSRRKQTMNRHLSSSPLFLELANRLTGDYRELIERTFNQLDRKLREELSNITRDLRASVTVEGETSEAGQDPRHAEELKRRVGVIQDALVHAQRIVREVRQ